MVFRNAFAVPVELSDVHLVCTLEQGIDFARRSSSLTHNSDAAQRSWSSSQSRTTQTQPQQDCDPFLAQLTAATDSYDADPKSSSPYIVEHVHVTLPPGGGGLGGALVRLRCGVSALNGTLRVVGVRWKLGGKIWGAAAFVRRGPRLRRTREERASRIRAPDASLAVHVVGDLPRVVARIRGLGDNSIPPAWDNSSAPPRPSSFAALHGEVRRGILELANIGRAPASDMLVRCNLPWIAVGGEIGINSPKGNVSVTHSALGASGLSWRAIDVRGNPMVLGRGESASLPVLFRAQGAGGKHQLQFLVQYAPLGPKFEPEVPRGWPPFQDGDLEAGDAANRSSMSRDPHAIDPPPLSRRVTLCIDITVLPSLTLETIKVIPKFNRPNAHHLSMTLANYYCADGGVSSALGRALRVTHVHALGDGTWQLHDALSPHGLLEPAHDTSPERCPSMDGQPTHTQVPVSSAPVDIRVGRQEQLALHYTLLARRTTCTAWSAGSDINIDLFRVEHAASRFEDDLLCVSLRHRQSRHKIRTEHKSLFT